MSFRKRIESLFKNLDGIRNREADDFVFTKTNNEPHLYLVLVIIIFSLFVLQSHSLSLDRSATFPNT